MTNQISTIDFSTEDLLTITLDGLRIYCQYTKSDNGKFILAFCDSDPYDNIAGHRTDGKGFYFLINTSVLTVIGQIERPNDGKVADNGFFILNDWLFTDSLKSVAYCFDENGKCIIQKNLNANLLKNSISKSGSFGLFQTVNSDNADGNTLFFYNLNEQKLLWHKVCDFAWPISYSILENERKINLHYKDIGTFSLDWNGNIIEKQEYKLKYASSLNGNRLVYEVIKLFGELNPNCNDILITLLEKGIKDSDTSPNTKAKGYKYLGYLLEKENPKKAFSYYEKALEFNSKIGLNRKLESLKSKF